MIRCPNCNTENDKEDLFCFSCGAPLALNEEKAKESAAGDNIQRDPDGYPIYDKKNGEAMRAQPNTAQSVAVGTRKAIEKDLKGLRPITRAAYYVVQSDNTTWVRAGLVLLFVASCVGIIMIISAIFNEMKLLVESMGISTQIQTGLTELYEGNLIAYTENLIAYIILLFVAIFVYILLGRLILRIKKVRRKKKKVEQKDMV